MRHPVWQRERLSIPFVGALCKAEIAGTAMKRRASTKGIFIKQSELTPESRRVKRYIVSTLGRNAKAKEAQTVTRKRPTGATPIPKGQPSDKAENRLGARLMNFSRTMRKVVSDSKDCKMCRLIYYCKVVKGLNEFSFWSRYAALGKMY